MAAPLAAVARDCFLTADSLQANGQLSAGGLSVTLECGGKTRPARTSKTVLTVVGACNGLHTGQQFRRIPALNHPVADLGQHR